jgi:biotin carboxyl carrier protein
MSLLNNIRREEDGGGPGRRLDGFVAELLRAASSEERLQAVCSLACEAAGAVGVAVFIKRRGKVGLCALAPTPAPDVPSPWLTTLAKSYGQMLAENCQIVSLSRGQHPEYGVFVPLLKVKDSSTVLAACVHGGRQIRLQGVSDTLQLARACLLATERGGNARREESPTEHDLGDILHILAEVQDCKRFFQSCSTLCAETAARFGCRRAALGVVKADSVKIVAQDQMDSFARGTRPVRLMEEAMQEALDQGGMTLYSRGEDGEETPPPQGGVPATRESAQVPALAGPLTGAGVITRASRELAFISDARRVLTIPVQDSEGVHFVMLFLFDGDEYSPRLTDGLNLICKLAGPRLLDLQRAEEFAPLRMWRRLVLRSADLFGPRRTALKLGAAIMAVALLLSLIIPGDLVVSAPMTVEGVHSYTHTAPMDGYLAEVFKRPGDRVHAGEFLGRLDSTEIEMEKASIEAQLNIYINQRYQYMQEGKDAEASIAALEAEKSRADLAWAEQRLSMTRLRSNVDGFVVSEDMFPRLGQPVRRGQELFEVTDTASMRVVAHVKEGDIADINDARARGEAAGEFTLTAYPELHIPMTVERVHPFASVVGDANGFEVRCRIDTIPGGLILRPGMEGYARINAGSEPLLFVWTRKLADRIRLLWWKWM